MRRDGIMARISARVTRAALERIASAQGAVRRRSETLLAAALVGGVVLMILHWS